VSVHSRAGDRNGRVSALPVHRFSTFRSAQIVHGVTTRVKQLPYHGNMSYMVGDDAMLVRQARAEWASAIGFDAERIVFGRQVHETTIAVVDETHAGAGADDVETSLRGVDGLITSTPGIPIGVMAADCVPILIFDPVNQAVGAIHAGWRGTVDGIAGKAIESMRTAFGSRPDQMRVGLGPAICRDCYEVGDEVVERWERQTFAGNSQAVVRKGTATHFDLRRANLEQLTGSGIPEAVIEVLDVCTRCSNGRMFSRRGLGPRTGLFSAIIMIRSDERLLNGSNS
jgi:polyphenol oxidase